VASNNTTALAAELTDEEILVNAIAPSVIDTPQNRKAMPDADFPGSPNRKSWPARSSTWYLK